MSSLIQSVIYISLLIPVISAVGLVSYYWNTQREQYYSNLKELALEVYSRWSSDNLEYLLEAYDRDYCIKTPPRDIKVRIEAIEEVLEERKLKDNTLK